MNELSTVHDSLEPEIVMSEADWTSEMEKVDKLLSSALMMGNPLVAFQYVRDAKAMGQLRGLAAARVLYQTWKDWGEYQKMGIDDAWENVAPGMCGLGLIQCRKYRDLIMDVYENEKVPEWVKKPLRGKPIEGQLYLIAAARDEDLTEEDWHGVANAVSPKEIRAIVRAARGATTSSESTISILLERGHKGGMGILKAKKGTNGKYVVLGALRNSREDTEGDDYEHRIRAIAIKRLVDGVGILEQ